MQLTEICGEEEKKSHAESQITFFHKSYVKRNLLSFTEQRYHTTMPYWVTR
jgi:hypothetical protein